MIQYPMNWRSICTIFDVLPACPTNDHKRLKQIFSFYFLDFAISRQPDLSWRKFDEVRSYSFVSTCNQRRDLKHEVICEGPANTSLNVKQERKTCWLLVAPKLLDGHTVDHDTTVHAVQNVGNGGFAGGLVSPFDPALSVRNCLCAKLAV